MLNPRRLPAMLVCVSLAAATNAFARATADAADDADDARSEARRGPIRSFFADHGAHLLLALLAENLTDAYSDSVGPSTHPLLFTEPGGLDSWIRERIHGPSETRGFVESHGLEALRYGVPLALVAVDVRDMGLLARDLAGYLELLLLNRSAVRLAKDIFGRERPSLEFAAEDGHSPPKIEQLDERDHNHRSFPSGHAAGSFAFVGYLDRALVREFGPRSRLRIGASSILHGLAGYISWSRLRRDKHYLTDVVAGGALGLVMSRVVYRMNHPGDSPAAGEGGEARSPIRLEAPTLLPGGLYLSLAIRVGRTPPGGAGGGPGGF